MPVQRCGIELGQQVHPLDAGIYAIGNRDVDQPIFARQRHCRLGPFTREGEKPRALSATKNYPQHP